MKVRNLHWKQTTFGVVLTLLLSATGVMKTEAQQPMFVSTEPSNRNVIIEDFTGRDCGYCPDGHRIANQIASNYPDRVWPIYIHAGYYSPTSYPNLNTVVGQQIHYGFNVSAYPSGWINRSTSDQIDRYQWNNYVNQQLDQSAECNIAGTLSVNPETRVATITVEVYYTGNSSYSQNYLTVAMLQDSILGSQADYGNYNPTQWVGDQYCHMHALRAVITENESIWGDPISPTTQGTLITRTYEYQIPESIGNPNGVEVNLDNIYFLAWVTETYQGTPTRPILNACKLFNDPYTHRIRATAYPAIGGNVSGSGSYQQSDTCTLSAVPNEGFEFLNWTENGDVVSTDEVYSFIVTGAVVGIRDFVAHFHSLNPNNIVFADANVEAICVAHWDTDGDGGLSYDEAAAVTNLGNAFRGNYGITSFDELQYFTGLTSIGGSAFEYCSNLTSIIIPENVTSIGDQAFYECNSLTGDLIIPNAVTTIGWKAFQSTGFTGNLILGNSLTWISGNAFYLCNFTGELTIPNSVEYIGVGAFLDCHGFTGTLTIGTGVTKIGVSAFRRCTGITAVQYNAINWQVLNGDDYEGEWYYLSDFMDKPIFNECGNLVSVAIGEQVENIPAYAFYHCSSLLGEITLPESLVSVGYYAFAGCDEITTINYNATNCTVMGSAQYPVFYDCISIQHINIGENVQSIPNYAFKRCFNVTDMSVAAEVPPTVYANTFGTVSRSIPVSVPYGSGEAYRTSPYWEEFFHITEDYSPNSYTYHWNVNIHQFEANMTVTGIVQIEGVEQAVPYLEIGAFCNGECRGRQLLTYYPEVDRYLVFLMLYGETGDMFNFRLYNHETNEESIAGCASVVTFEPNAIVGSFEEPFVFNFTNMQLTQFYQGWNWWSTYIEQEGIDGLAMLEESLGENGYQIKSQTDFVTNFGTMWFGMLGSINNEETYMINNTADCIVTMPGMPATPSDHPITISGGWNWIGYPCTNTMSVSEAFAGLESTNGDQVKSQADYAMYFNGIWIGQLQNITPGTGLMYMSNNAVPTTLVYPNGGRNTEVPASPKTTHWTNDIHAYPHNMTVMAVVELDEVELNTDNYELSAFDANGECRGSAKLVYVEPLDRYVAFLTIAGNDAVELGFRLYDAETGAEYTEAAETLSFVTNATVGEPDDVYVVRFRGTTGMDELSSSVQVYPNPVNKGEQFSIRMAAESKSPIQVELVNAMGVETLHATSVQTSAVITAPTVTGVYTLRVTVEGKGTVVQKLIVK